MSAGVEDRATTLRLPDGRRLAISPALSSTVLCGVLVENNVVVGDAPALATEMAALAEALRTRYAGRSPGTIPVLAEARRLYRAAGVDPTRTRPSSEALLRRALKAQPMPFVNAAVDAVNLASLSFHLPIGLYDLDRVRGDAELRLGGSGAEYPGIRKGDVHLEGRLGLFDADGPFGSPTSDSPRTSVDGGTRRLLAVIFASSGYARAAMIGDVDLLARILTRYCGGEVALRALLPQSA